MSLLTTAVMALPGFPLCTDPLRFQLVLSAMIQLRILTAEDAGFHFGAMTG